MRVKARAFEDVEDYTTRSVPQCAGIESGEHGWFEAIYNMYVPVYR